MKKKILTILLSSAMIFSMGISTVSAAAADDTASTESIVVSKTEGITDTTYGKVRGFIDNGTYTFRGIPYAKADRFEMPEAPDSWDGIRNCLVYGSTAPITKMTDPDGGDFLIPHRYWAQSENCQNLNVWTQDLEHYAKKPGRGMMLVPGMVFTIEPMINMGDWHVFIDAADNWTVVSEDELPSAQWEHTFVMREHGLEILTH